MHHELKTSGLGELYKVRTTTTNTELAEYLGKTVRYKRELCMDPEFLRQNGTIIKTATFKIREVQIDHAGREALRGYHCEAAFGRVIYPEHVEIV